MTYRKNLFVVATFVAASIATNIAAAQPALRLACAGPKGKNVIINEIDWDDNVEPQNCYDLTKPEESQLGKVFQCTVPLSRFDVDYTDNRNRRRAVLFPPREPKVGPKEESTGKELAPRLEITVSNRTSQGPSKSLQVNSLYIHRQGPPDGETVAYYATFGSGFTFPLSANLNKYSEGNVRLLTSLERPPLRGSDNFRYKDVVLASCRSEEAGFFQPEYNISKLDRLIQAVATKGGF